MGSLAGGPLAVWGGGRPPPRRSPTPPVTLKNYADQCPQYQTVSRAATLAAGGDYRARLYRAHELSYLDAQRRPYIHLVDGAVAATRAGRRLRARQGPGRADAARPG